MGRDSAHAGAASIRARNGRSQQAGNLPQLGAGAANGCCNGIQARPWFGSDQRQAGLGIGLRVALCAGLGPRTATRSALEIKGLAGSGQRVSLGVDQAFDFKGQLDFAAAVKPLAGAAFVGFELRKLRLPKAQNISFKLAKARHISNFEVEAVGDRRRVVGALVGELRGHNDDKEEPEIRGRHLTLSAV